LWELCESMPPRRIPTAGKEDRADKVTAVGGIDGLVPGTIRANPVADGLAFGSEAWALSSLQLVPMGIYKPPRRYPAKTLAVDLPAHLVYGAGAAGA
jgi:hypothetical protein